MSNESISSNFVTQNQFTFAEKFAHKISKNKNKGISQSSVRKTTDKQSVHLDSEERKEKEIKSQKSKSSKQKETFPRHISEKEIDKLLKNQNTNDAQYVEGYLRINPGVINMLIYLYPMISMIY